MIALKFIYHYKTKDGVAHEGGYSARSRTAVYDELKAKGVKPFNVEPAPGLVNRLLVFLGVRGLLLVLLAVAALAYLVLAPRGEPDGIVSDDIFLAGTRRQPIGDSAIVDAGIRSGWASAFADEGERFLASFAVPGTTPAVMSTKVEELNAALARQILPQKSDNIETVQIKSMVEGMKRELRAYVAAGGSVKQYGERLLERQKAEIACYNKVATEIQAAFDEGKGDAEIARIWEGGNAELRRMGIRAVPLPTEKK